MQNVSTYVCYTNLFLQSILLLHVSNIVRQRLFTKLHGVKTPLSTYGRPKKSKSPTDLPDAEPVISRERLLDDAEVNKFVPWTNKNQVSVKIKSEFSSSLYMLSDAQIIDEIRSFYEVGNITYIF